MKPKKCWYCKRETTCIEYKNKFICLECSKKLISKYKFEISNIKKKIRRKL